MHKKKIGGKEYFYTSVRDNKGKVKTIYLGSNKKNALLKEKELGISSQKKIFNLHSSIILLISLLLLFSGFLAFTGFDVLEPVVNDTSNQKEIEEEVEEELDLMEEEETDSTESLQSTPLEEDTSSSPLSEEDEEEFVPIVLNENEE